MNGIQAMNRAMKTHKTPLSMEGTGTLAGVRTWLGFLLVCMLLTGCSLFSPAHAVDVWPKDWIPGGAITNGQLVTDSSLSVLPGTELFLEVGVANDNDLWVIRRKSDYSIVDQQNEPDTITYEWEGSGSFTSPNSRTSYWTAPQSSGTYTLTCTIDDQPKPVIPPETGSRNDMAIQRTITVRVVKVDELQYRFSSEDDFEEVPNPLMVPLGQTVEFRATKTPSSGSWPGGKPAWGGTSGATGTGITTSVTFNTVSTTNADYKTVTVECGNTITANIVVVKLDKLQYRIDKPGTEDDEEPYADVTGMLTIPTGTTVHFKAFKYPSDADWPENKPIWGGVSGASGMGETKSVTFSEASEDAEDFKTVTAECGNVITVDVLVFDVTLEIKRKGTPDTDYGESAVIAVGGKSNNEHQCDIRVQLTPALSGLTIPLPTIVGGESALGEEEPGAAVISIVNEVTDNEGKAFFSYASSNKTTDSINVELNWGAAEESVSIDQRWNDVDAWTGSEYYFYGTPLILEYKPRFDAGNGVNVPITDHKINFIIKQAQVWVWDEQAGQYNEETYLSTNPDLNPLLPMKVIAESSGNEDADLVTISPWYRQPDEWNTSPQEVDPGTYLSSVTVVYLENEIVDRVDFRVQDDETYE